MAKTRNILNHLRFEHAIGKRSCDVSEDHLIQAGDKHFAYEQVPGQRKNICMQCAPQILKIGKDHLAKLLKEIKQP